MLNLKELRFSGIGRFVEEQVVHFESLGRLVQLDGKNNNTRGSSGAGKTTVFNAMDFLLGFNDIPNGVLKSRHSENPINVKGIFEYNGRPLTITRGRKLLIDHDGEITTGSSKLTEEKLDQILAMPRHLFRKILHKRQGEGGFFLPMTPREINDFLMDCLDLSHFRPKILTVENYIKELEDKKNSVLAKVESAKSGLQATKDAYVSLGSPPEKDIDQATILGLKIKLDGSTSVWNGVQAQHKLELDAVEAMRPDISSTAYDRSKLEALEKESVGLENEIRALKVIETDRLASAKMAHLQLNNVISNLQWKISSGQEAHKESLNVANQIKKIRDGKCFTCGQDWKDAQKEAQLIQSLKPLKEKIDAGTAAASDLPLVQVELDRIVPQLTPREIPKLAGLLAQQAPLLEAITVERAKEKAHQATESTKNKEVLSKFASMQALTREKHSKESEQARGQLDLDRRAFEAAVAKLKLYEDCRTRYERSLTTLKDQEAAYSHNVSELTKTSIQTHNELALAEELKRALKSYLSCSFDDALETISDGATKLIRHIPNMANATIQLEGVRETLDGKIKEEVNAVIHMDGEENVPIRSLCGGERTATDLAIDISVIDLIENKANKGIDIFVLDEPFNGLDTVCIEMALEVLKNCNINKRLIIVDHNPEVKQMVESKLLVTRDGPTSRITQA